LSVFWSAVIGYILVKGMSMIRRRVLIWLAQVSLSLPTVLIGLLLYLLLSRRGPLGELGWLFSQAGIVAGQVLIALPVLIAFTVARYEEPVPTR